MKPAAKPSQHTRIKFGFLWHLMADAELSPSAKCAAVALVFKFHNNRNQRCNPSFSELGRIVGRKRRSTIDAIQELKDAGWLKVKSTKGGSKQNTNGFVFDFSQRARVSSTAPDKDEEPVQSAAPDPVQSTAPVHEITVPVQSTAHEPLRTNSPLRRGEGVSDSAALAPDGAAQEEKFSQLCQAWQRPHGLNEPKARKAFNRVCGENDADDVLASAGRWLAAVQPQFLPALDNWLADGAWQNNPPAKRAAGRGGKANPVDEMLNAGDVRRGQ